MVIPEPMGGDLCVLSTNLIKTIHKFIADFSSNKNYIFKMVSCTRMIPVHKRKSKALAVCTATKCFRVMPLSCGMQVELCQVFRMFTRCEIAKILVDRYLALKIAL